MKARKKNKQETIDADNMYDSVQSFWNLGRFSYFFVWDNTVMSRM